MSTDSSSLQGRRETRRAEILELFAQRDRERLTWKQLSERSGIPVGTLTSWQQALRKEARKKAGFVELAPKKAASQPGHPALTLETAAGLRIHLPPGFDADTLRQVLSTLGVPC